MRLGLIVNPVAGVGGALGFAGSDGPLAAAALAAGAVARVDARTKLALAAISAGASIDIVTSAGPMGGDAARAAGFCTEIVHCADGGLSSAADTMAAASAIADRGVDLLLFAGGDTPVAASAR